jgi:acetoacetyl-CoA synthetase
MGVAMDAGKVLWEPTPSFAQQTNIYSYMRYLKERCGLTFPTYNSLWEWSVEELEKFWTSAWEYFQIRVSVPYCRVLSPGAMPNVKWFEGSRLNYAEHIFRNATKDRPAIIFQSELRPLSEISWGQLYREVSSLATALKDMGLTKGDRVVSILPNIPEAVIAFLACSSIGAVWSSCAPEIGASTMIDRFKQIEPKILVTVDGYRYNGKDFDVSGVISELQKALPTLEQTILVHYLSKSRSRPNVTATLWDDLVRCWENLTYEQVDFAHPLWILYSSGTTGLPKPIVHGHGGILIEQLKAHSLHLDLKPTDRLFWFTTTGWMMWNFTVGGLLLGSTIVLYDGCPWWPEPDSLWTFVENSGTTIFGTSAAYISSCMKMGTSPCKDHEFSKIKAIGATGSPLSAEAFNWIYEFVKPDVWLACISGGTDICTSLVGSCPLLPVHAGEMQCRCLGVKVEAFNEQGEAMVDEVGELVVTKPMPSMPLFFWNDDKQERYRESYFNLYDGVWRHGDWIKITQRGTAQIYGRSDSTINRHGVRMGTSEMYRVVEAVPEVVDSLVIDLELSSGPYMPLFVVLRAGVPLTDELKLKITDRIRSDLSPRHVPDDIFAISEVPRTLNGKKMEVPIKKILSGIPCEKAVNPDSMSNPTSIVHFLEFATSLGDKAPA